MDLDSIMKKRSMMKTLNRRTVSLIMSQSRRIPKFQTVLALIIVACCLCPFVRAQESSVPLQPFIMDHHSDASSLADVSFLLDPPAGKDGFIRVQGNHLVKPDGKHIRFWGFNLTEWSRGSTAIPPKEDAPRFAATLARFGVNCVRLHFLDLYAPRGLIDGTRDDSQHFDPNQLDREDFFIAELKKRGIYINLNLNVGRSYKAGDNVKDYDKIRRAKGLTLFDPRLIELQKDYAKQILTHCNPYTKTEYRNEPALAIVEILNENALYIGFRSTPYYNDQLTELYNVWLKKNLSAEKLDKLREMAGVSGDEPIPCLKRREIREAPKERYDTEMDFFTETETNFYEDMYSYLKDSLGVRCPIIATADHSHSGSSYPMLMATSQLDILDGHAYWEHPGDRGHQNTPMVNNPFNSTIVELSRTAFAGKPYTVSEINHPFSNQWASEGIPILASYASFHDWDGIFFYTFERKLLPEHMFSMPDPFDMSHDPVKMPQIAAGALIFLRGDVRPARQTIERSYTKDQVYQSTSLPRTEQPYFTPGFPLRIPLQHGSRIRSLDGEPTGKFTADDSNPIVSDTEELAWHLTTDKTNVVTVDTERSQALIGFIKANPKKLSNLAADIENDFCAIVLNSLDSEPISNSARMLLTACARSENTDMVWNESRTRTKNSGKAPSMIEPVIGKIILRNLNQAKTVSVKALDAAGQAIGEPIAGKLTEDAWEVEIGAPATTWYEVSVGR